MIGRDSPFRAGSQLNKLVESKRAAGAKIYFGTDQNVVKNAYFYRKVSPKARQETARKLAPDSVPMGF